MIISSAALRGLHVHGHVKIGATPIRSLRGSANVDVQLQVSAPIESAFSRDMIVARNEVSGILDRNVSHGGTCAAQIIDELLASPRRQWFARIVSVPLHMDGHQRFMHEILGFVGFAAGPHQLLL